MKKQLSAPEIPELDAVFEGLKECLRRVSKLQVQGYAARDALVSWNATTGFTISASPALAAASQESPAS